METGEGGETQGQIQMSPASSQQKLKSFRERERNKANKKKPFLNFYVNQKHKAQDFTQ